MKYEYTVEIIREIENRIKEDTSNCFLMNQLAIGYLNNSDAGGWNKIDDFFKQCYATKPNLETANNLAYQMTVDWNEPKKSIELLQKHISVEYSSYYPFNLLAYSYLLNEEYHKADKFYTLVKVKTQSFMSNVEHNHAVAKSKLNEIDESITMNQKLIEIEDLNNQTFNNLMVNYLEKGKTELVDKELNNFIETEKYSRNNLFFSNHEISLLFFANNNYEKAYELISEDSNYWISSFPEFAYLLYHFNKKKYDAMIEIEIEMQRESLLGLDNPEDELTKEMSESEIINAKFETRKEIEKVSSLYKQLNEPENIKLKELYQITSCGCLLYGCKVHNNEKMAGDNN